MLIGGRRRPLAGMVTMDQIVVDCGPVGRRRWRWATRWCCIGRQGTSEITAEEWAGLLGTISYEVLCGIGPRVPRRTVELDRHGRTRAATGSAASPAVWDDASSRRYHSVGGDR